MITLLALLLMSNSAKTVIDYQVGHCYCTDSEFNARCVKILTVAEKKYSYSKLEQNEYIGSFSNSKNTINNVYVKETNCTK